ncbi:MAG: hypothetical protein ACYC6Y_03105, partial [Thermoguttaceae bacterium]
YGHPLSKVHSLFEKYASRVFHTHCKSIKYPAEVRETQREMGWKYGEYNCPIDQGDIDFERIVKALRKAGYKNDLCIEDESLGKQPAEQCKTILAGEIGHLGKCLAEA